MSARSRTSPALSVSGSPFSGDAALCEINPFEHFDIDPSEVVSVEVRPLIPGRAAHVWTLACDGVEILRDIAGDQQSAEIAAEAACDAYVTRSAPSP